MERESDVGAGNPIYEDKYSVSYMWEEILTKDSVLELISNFVFLEVKEEVDEQQGRKKIKETIIFPRYHQRDVLHKILADVYEMVLHLITSFSIVQALEKLILLHGLPIGYHHYMMHRTKLFLIISLLLLTE